MIKSEADLQIENLTRNEEINIVLRCVDFMEDCIYVEIGDALKSPDIKTWRFEDEFLGPFRCSFRAKLLKPVAVNDEPLIEYMVQIFDLRNERDCGKQHWVNKYWPSGRVETHFFER
jgi:hypothetical protein